jgi:hypothetical protein
MIPTRSGISFLKMGQGERADYRDEVDIKFCKSLRQNRLEVVHQALRPHSKDISINRI